VARFDRLSTQSKDLVDTIKMVAYRAETAMVQIGRQKMTRHDDARSLLRSIYSTEVDIDPDSQAKTLTIRLHPFANPSSDTAVGISVPDQCLWAQIPIRTVYSIDKSPARRSCWNDGSGGVQVLRLLVLAIAAIFTSKALLIAENLCLRQQLVVLQRRHPRPRLSDADRRFWMLASRWFSDWRHPLLIVKPETVLGWQRAGWRAYWRWRSSYKARGGRPAIPVDLQALIARMAAENRLWGQKRIQAELARLGFQVSARTVAKYMRGCRRRRPTRTWREFLMRHASNMWACDFFCVPTVLFQTLHVFFVIRLANREILHVAVTRHPTADWAAQQIVECCAWDRAPPRFTIATAAVARTSIVACGVSEYGKFVRRSGRPEPMRSLRDG
jgi:hypothetical protein